MSIIVETEDGKVFEDSDGSRVFTTKSGYGYELSFNVNYIKEEHLHWFCQVVGQQYKDAAKIVARTEKRNIRNTIKKALGID